MRLESMDFLPLHWHKEIQFVFIKNGCAQYRVGTDVFVLKQGEGLFINASGLHEAKPYQIEQAIVYCVNVDPKLLGGHEGSIFFSKYELFHTRQLEIPSFRARLILVNP